MEIRERIKDGCPVQLSRFDPTPVPYTLLIKERFNDDGSVEVISRKRVYDSILGSCTIIEEKENKCSDCENDGKLCSVVRLGICMDFEQC